MDKLMAERVFLGEFLVKSDCLGKMNKVFGPPVQLPFGPIHIVKLNAEVVSLVVTPMSMNKSEAKPVQ